MLGKPNYGSLCTVSETATILASRVAWEKKQQPKNLIKPIIYFFGIILDFIANTELLLNTELAP